MPNDTDDNKVFDVSKPGNTAADPNSRPIIVSNRSILKDPMFKGDKDDNLVDDDDSKDKKPVSDEPKKTNHSDATDIPNLEPVDKDLKLPKHEDRVSKPETSDKPYGSDPTETSDEPVKEDKHENTGEEDKPEHAKKEAPEAEQNNQLSNPQQANIDKLVESKQYFVPISLTKGKRSVWLVVVVIAAILIFGGLAMILLK